ncbi:MAG: antitoxin VapB family protein [Promethearchaeota archaeon]
MGSKTITISEDAYNALLKEKLRGESFSDVILRLTRRFGRIMESFGKLELDDDEYNKIKRELQELWARWEI